MLRDKKVRGKLRRHALVLAAATLIALLLAGFFLMRQSGPILSFNLNQDISVDLIEVVQGSDNSFKAPQPFNYNRFFYEKLPRRIGNQLINWKVIDPHAAGGYIGTTWTAGTGKADSLVLVFQQKFSDDLAALVKTDIEKVSERISGISREGYKATYHRVRLQSMDGSFVDNTGLELNSSWSANGRRGTGDYKVSFAPFAKAHFQWVPPNVPQFELTIFKATEDEILSSATAMLDNPHYREIPDPGPVRKLPITESNGDVSVTLKRIVGNVAREPQMRKSLTGEPGEELLSSGVLLRANKEAAERGNTWIQLDILENGEPSSNWEPGYEHFYYGDGSKIGTGYGVNDTGHGFWYSSQNASIADGPVTFELALRRKANFPVDEYTTVSLPLPGVGKVIEHKEKVSFWNGAFSISKIENQHGNNYQGIKVTATGPKGEDGVKLKAIHLVNDETTHTLKNVGVSSSYSPGDTVAAYDIAANLNLSSDKPDTTMFSTVTLELAAPRTLKYNFIVEPESATVVAEPLDRLSLF